MSIWYTHEARCPNCRADLSFDLARGVHISRVPHVRAAILDGSFHHPMCHECGTTFEVAREVVYTDFGRHHWIHVAAPGRLRMWRDAEGAALALFDNVFRAGPPAAQSLAALFRTRVVFDYGELRERLVIWDACLDDALVECAKLLAIREHLELAGSDRRLRVRTVRPDGDLELISVATHDLSVIHAELVIDAPTIRRLADDRSTWQDRYPELFGRGFVSVDRLLREP
jgi:hypothetical protein